MAVRVVVTQIGVALAVAALFLLQGLQSALSALSGSLAIALGTALLAGRMFARPGASSAFAWNGVLMGLALKWFIVIGAMFLVLGRWQLPPVPLLIGLAAALAVNLVALRFKN
jgi:F0F1-type ATP synthase assembly protein I